MKILLTCLLLLFISGCQKFHEIQVRLEDNKLIFYNDEINSTCEKGIVISDFGVQYIGKSGNAIAWELVRSFETAFDASSFDMPLTYGDSIKDIKIVTKAMSLIEGRYNFGGTLLCKMRNNNKSITVNGYYLIDESGNLVEH